ncbi:transcriptional regulator [Streptomyces sp. CC53]|uniref:transcriptional regulator n=1 Tax=unclassified Streptomyces TaxID=2593676 RepID=UPI0008DDC04B|nr:MULTISPECIES: transcriptional regulator [unclassified Streptomyces]OII63585.1 transcriptional regulator [Streptomyces sp. CC53]OII67239.1 transcriptional regulator [Streptomyces sp. CC77]
MTDAHAPLADVLARISELTGRPGRLTDVLDVGDLSYRTGVPVDVVADLLAGRPAPEVPLADRVRQRLEFVRETRRRPDGKRYSLDEMAKVAGVSRQSLTEWHRSSLPKLEHADRLRRFFGLPAGFLTADEAEALCHALQPVVQDLEARVDPLARLRDSGLVSLASRAHEMTPSQLAALAQMAEVIIAKNGGSGEGAEGADPRRSENG